MADYNKAGLLCVRDNRLLLCRKSRGTQLLILPGGKFEGSESAVECLERELREELGEVHMRNPVYAGVVELDAADPGKTLRMELYRADLEGTPTAQAEIAELIWFGAGDDPALLAPSIRHILETGIVVLSPEEASPEMQPSPAHVQGAPCWFELATTDQKAANAFYTQLFGWSVNDAPVCDGVYSMYQLDGRDVGAGYTMMPNMVAAGVPPHWAVYFATSNADQTAAKVTELGGSLIQPPFDVMDHGRMAVCKDPEGTAFCLWQPKSHAGATAMGELNTVCWSELATRDIAKARDFYIGLFGWETKVSTSAPTEYTEFIAGGQPRGGLLQMNEMWAGIPSHWGIYFRVADTDATVERVQQLGGSVKHEAFDAPGVGRIAVLADPQGAVFSVIRLSM